MPVPENLTVKDCKFTGYWKGLYLNSTKGLVIEGCDFENMNPFSMDAYDASMQVTGNMFRRSSIWDRQMCHFIVTEGMDNSTRYAESWSLDLKKTVYALFTENAWWVRLASVFSIPVRRLGITRMLLPQSSRTVA